MMYQLCRYDVMLPHNAVAPVGRNDAMFAISLGEADIIHEVNIISAATSFAEGKHHSKNKSKSFHLLLFLRRVDKKDVYFVFIK